PERRSRPRTCDPAAAVPRGRGERSRHSRPGGRHARRSGRGALPRGGRRGAGANRQLPELRAELDRRGAGLSARRDVRHPVADQRGAGAMSARALPMSRGLDDRGDELVDALRHREEGAAERLVATYQARAYRLALRITANAQDAEEVVQDAFWSV